jgi:hypothetical protein
MSLFSKGLKALPIALLLITNLAMGDLLPNDINGDGNTDLFFQNKVDGRIFYWLMKGDQLTFSDALPAANTKGALLDWRLVGSIDLNKDGSSDLLFQNRKNGSIAYWLMNGRNLISGHVFPSVPGADLISWRLVGAADMNKDGNADLVWQNKFSGKIAYWLLNGVSLIYAQEFPTQNDAVKPLRGLADYNRDGNTDLVWQYPSLSEDAVPLTMELWSMNGFAPTYKFPAPINISDDYVMTGAGTFDFGNNIGFPFQNRRTGEILYVGGVYLTYTFSHKTSQIFINPAEWQLVGF